MSKRWLAVALMAATAFCAGGWAAHYKRENVRTQSGNKRWSRQRQVAWEDLKRRLSAEIRHFDGQAGVVIEDLQTGWSMAYQPERLFPAASVIKVPMMTACFQAAQEGKLDLNSRVEIRPADKAPGSGVLKTLPDRTEVPVSQLIDWMVTRSDNTAANLLISKLGMDYFNRHFRQLGLSGTELSRRMMDFSLRRRGVENYTTAEDMARVLEMIYRQQAVSPQVSRASLELLERQHLHDRIPALLPRGTPVAHKTGLERSVCHDAGIIFTRRGDLLICVLTQRKPRGTSRPAKRFIARLAREAYRYAEGAP